ncbi:MULTISPECIES: ClpXP adapter SpxH family protein [unclassified Bacillus (in: firmicutes)]|uniref:ClpXP adapter SpxH family protein n=1 Tax=unclassified Bacillus (in: firmicutes) TaxID=185979 RepID=UPI0008EC21EF|nr:MULTISPECIES: ClpXP adapter SpxH family protein [unclassified Bacillus (in: firmicutes)]SFA78474.1 Predicted dithiol-disulfide isomerase, DsbA family [Bacillus sp. UNCCL13]SFQ68408.1 Predicted dithiol-disulfide isomerase, DsbA family [Bacillus sp. cl95]
MKKHENSYKSHQTPHHCHGNEKKPIEIYMFVDPLCPECWAIEPIMKKLQIEYGRYFSIKHVLSGRLATLNMGKKKNYENIADMWEKTASRSGMSCDGSLWFENPVSSPYIASIAIKAAELQGRRAGIRFLRKLQEVLFLDKQNVSNFEVLKDCARQVGLDVEEFITDIHSESSAKAFQCDLKITSEMDVQEIPTLVFFNDDAEEEGIKITGYYPYEVYVQILEEMLQERPTQSEPPPLEAFLKFFSLVASKEIAVVYDMTVAEVEREMKKLLLKQVVTQVPAKYGTFWKYSEQS